MKKIDYERDDFINTPWYYKLISFLLYWCLSPILMVIKKFFLRVKVRGKANYKQVKKGGAVIVCNHIHPMDAPMIAMSIFPTRMKIMSLEDNFYKPVVGTIIKGLGALPVPKDFRYMKDFLDTFSGLAKSGKKVLIYPEGHLIKRSPTLREFKTGAFRVAISAGVPIIPMCYTYPGGKGLTLNILPPVYPKPDEDPKELTAKVYNIINEFFISEMSKGETQPKETDEVNVEQIEDEVFAKKHA